MLHNPRSHDTSDYITCYIIFSLMTTLVVHFGHFTMKRARCNTWEKAREIAKNPKEYSQASIKVFLCCEKAKIGTKKKERKELEKRFNKQVKEFGLQKYIATNWAWKIPIIRNQKPKKVDRRVLFTRK